MIFRKLWGNLVKLTKEQNQEIADQQAQKNSTKRGPNIVENNTKQSRSCKKALWQSRRRLHPEKNERPSQIYRLTDLFSAGLYSVVHRCTYLSRNERLAHPSMSQVQQMDKTKLIRTKQTQFTNKNPLVFILFLEQFWQSDLFTCNCHDASKKCVTMKQCLGWPHQAKPWWLVQSDP